MALLHHPDKFGHDEFDEAKKVKWHQILESYETLIDKTKRRRYDSTLEFNDEIPRKFDEKTQNFYECFGDYFRINSYWSKVKNPP